MIAQSAEQRQLVAVAVLIVVIRVEIRDVADAGPSWMVAVVVPVVTIVMVVVVRIGGDRLVHPRVTQITTRRLSSDHRVVELDCRFVNRD